MSGTTVRSIFTLILLCVLSGCSSHFLELPLPGNSKEIQGPARESILSSFGSIENPRSFRAMLETDVEGHGRREEFKQAVTFDRAGKLRLEAFGSGVNQLLFLAVVDNGKLRAVLPQDRQILFGPANRKAFEHLINIPLSAEELMVWITGGILPAFSRFEQAKVYDLGEGRFLVEAKDRDERILRLSGRKTVLPRFEQFSLSIDGHGVILGSYEYESPKALFPTKIHFKLKDLSGDILVERAQVNPEIPPQVFNISEPNGYSRVEIGR